MSRLLIKAKTAWALGLLNLVRVVWYRLGVKHGWHAVRRIHANTPEGPFFRMLEHGDGLEGVPPPTNWWASLCYFDWFSVDVSSAPPNWFLNPITGKTLPNPHRPWWSIADFNESVGDIKVIWEASRFDWILCFATRAASGDKKALERLNTWLADWSNNNPPYQGPNWKCGQEASIRVLHLVMAVLIMAADKALLPGLEDLLCVHLQRIEPTIGYAVAQDNNHGTSEAAALYVGGLLLSANGNSRGAHWAQQGRRWLENRVKRLFMPDGSFSQYSVTYHRVALVTLCMAEVARRRFDDASFSKVYVQRAQAATHWLDAMTQGNGDAPNLGANDGANFFHVDDSAYRDFRPAVQLASVLFCDRSVFPDSSAALQWLNIPVPTVSARQAVVSECFNDGGYGILRDGAAFALLRFSRFRFRPSQADALHVDFWLAGENLLRDAGTYSYNVAAGWLDYFSGTQGHNTVQFDDRDQMPRLSRFLFGDWLQAHEVKGPFKDDGIQTFSASYCDKQKARHQRSISLGKGMLKVVDKVDGFGYKAVLRWRLKPGDWQLDGAVLRLGNHVLEVTSNVPLRRVALVEGWESRHYLEKTAVPVLEVEVDQPAFLETTYTWM